MVREMFFIPDNINQNSNKSRNTLTARQKTKSFKVHNRYKKLDVSKHLWIYLKLHIGEDLQRVCIRCEGYIERNTML